MRMQLTKIALAASVGLALAFTLSCSDGDGDGRSGGGSTLAGNSGTFKDSRDNKTYKWVQIGTQIWMAENLNCDVGGSKCYDNDPTNCDKYGRLYDWATAMNLPSSCNSSSCASQIGNKHQGICPSGWHLPSEAEWDALSSYVESDKGCSNCDAKHLKSTSNWYNNGNGLDSYGFAALPGVGGYDGYWWSTSEYGTNSAYSWSMGYSYESTYGYGDSEDNLFSVRCLQD